MNRSKECRCGEKKKYLSEDEAGRLWELFAQNIEAVAKRGMTIGIRNPGSVLK